MRDFRDSKVMAQTLRAALAARGHKITIGESLELIAKAFGVGDWNTLAATIKTAASNREEWASADKLVGNNRDLDNAARLLGVDDWNKLRALVQAAPTTTPPRTASEPSSSTRRSASGRSFSAGLVTSLHKAVELATIRKHDFTTPEHLLLALIDDADAAEVMRACHVDLPKLGESLTAYIDDELQLLVQHDGRVPVPTAGFHRVIQRAVIHAQSSGRDDVTGANVLVAIFSDRDSHAANFLRRQGVERIRGPQTDPDFDALRDDPRFQKMLATAETRLAASQPGWRGGRLESA